MGCFIRSGQGHPSGSRRDPAPSGNRHSTGSGRRSHSCRPQQILMAFAPRVGPVSQLSISRATHANSGLGTVRLPDFAARRATFSRRSPRTNVDRSVKGNGDFVPVVGLRAANPTASMSSFRHPSGAPVDPGFTLKPRAAATRPLQGRLRIPPVALRYPFLSSSESCGAHHFRHIERIWCENCGLSSARRVASHSRHSLVFHAMADRGQDAPLVR